MTEDTERYMLGWVKADVGFYWERGSYAVMTVIHGDVRFYQVMGTLIPGKSKVIGQFNSWDEVEAHTNRRG